MKHYKTLKGLLSQTRIGEINFEEFHWHRFYHKEMGWIDFSLDEKEENIAYKMFADCIYSRRNGEQVYRIKNYNGHQHRILRGLTLNLERWRGEYTAGQDYVYEMRVIKGIFRNGN